MVFQDKVVAVSGAAMGIGKAAALAFAREGAWVALVDSDVYAGKQALQEFEGLPGEAALFTPAMSQMKPK